MNYLCYFLSFAFILYFFNRFHPASLKQSKAKLLLFTTLYLVFVIFYNPYFNWFFWVLMSFLFYVILDDIWHREFNILIPIFISIIAFLSSPSWLLLTLILFVFISFYLFPYLQLLFKKMFKKTKKNQETADTMKTEKSLFKRIFLHINETFRHHSGMGEGDPWLICTFLLLTPFTLWIPFLLLSWIVGLLFFLFNFIFVKKDSTVALAPILLLAYTLLLIFQN